MQLSLVFLFLAGTLGGSDLSKKMRIEIKRGGVMGVLHLVFSDQRLNYTGFCEFEEGGSCVYFQKITNNMCSRILDVFFLYGRCGPSSVNSSADF